MKRIFTLFKIASLILLFPVLSFGQGAVTSVSSAPTGAYYKATQTVSIVIAFSPNVDITTGAAGNQVSLLLNNGVTLLSATNLALTNVSTLTLSYVVGAGGGENVSPLNYNATTSLTLQGTATIVKNGGTAITLTLPATGAAAALGNSNVTIDNVSPSAFTAGAVTTSAGGTVVAGYYNISNTGGINVVVPIANDNSLNGGTVQLQVSNTGSGGPYVNLGSSVSIGAINTNQNVAISDAVLRANAKFTDGSTLNYKAIITDLAANSTTSSASASTTIVDQTAPAGFTVGAVASTGGTVVAGYYNISNTGISVTVPIANDATLNGGTVQLQIDNQSAGGLINLGSTASIGAVNTNQNVSINNATLTGNGKYANGNTLTFDAIITDVAGNSTAGTASASTLDVSRTAPAAFTVGAVTTSAGGTVVAGYYNISNTGGINVVVPVANSAILSGGTIQIQVSNSGVGGPYVNLGSAVAIPAVNTNQNVPISDATLRANAKFTNGSTLNYTAIITDASGNPTTGTNSASTTIIDTSAPAAFTVGTNSTNAGGTVVTGYYNGTNNGGVTINVPIANDATLVLGTVQLLVDNQVAGGYINLGSAVSIPTKNVVQGISIDDATLSGSAKYADGNTLTFKAIITDVAGNATTGTVSVSTLKIDLTDPSGFTVGAVVSTGGTVLVGIYNSTNTGIQVTVPIANDNTLNGGTVQLRIDNQVAGGLINLGSAAGIGAINTNQNVPIASATLTANAKYANTNTLTFDAIITDVAGNSVTGTASVTTLNVQTTVPSAFTVGAVTTSAGGTVVAGYYNTSNNGGINIVVPVANSAALNTGTIQVQVSNSGVGGPYISLGSAVSIPAINTNQNIPILDATLRANAKFVDGSTLNYKAIITDIYGNATTGTASASTTIIDQTAPAAFTVGSNSTNAGGFIVTGYYNGTNTGGITVNVPIANDATLVVGSLQLLVDNQVAGGYINLGAAVPIPTKNVTQGVSINNATLTANAKYANGNTLTFKAIITDVAGNTTTGAVSVSTLKIDTTPPTISGTPCYNSNGSSNETVDIAFSENLGMADLTSLTITNSAPTANSGWFESGSAGNNLGSAIYHQVSGAGPPPFLANIVRLTSNQNSKWSSSDKITYTTSPAVPTRDVAGNELVTISNATIGNCGAPSLQSSMVLSPNGTSAETITFLVDQLNLASPSPVTGLTTSTGTISSAVYTLVGAGLGSITITSGGDGQWTGTTLVNYIHGLGGNIANSAAEIATFSESIILTPVTIASNNAAPAWAKAGNNVVVTFTLNRNVSTLTATINGGAVTPVKTSGTALTAGAVYTATLVTTGATVEGLVTFDITMDENALQRTTDVTVTLDNSTVTFDKTAPVITPVTIISNNSTNTARAKVGDIVTVSYTPTDNLGTISLTSKTIDGFAPTTSTLASSTLTTSAADNNGVMPFSFTFTDQAGNATVVTATTNASSVTFDKVVPFVSSINVVGGNLNGIGTSNGTSNTTLTYTVTFSENVTGLGMGDFTLTPSGFAGNALFPLVGGTITGLAGGPLTYTVTATPITNTGVLRLDYNGSAAVIDVAGNPAAAAFTTGQTYEVVLPAPSNNVTLLSASGPSTTSIKLDWTNPLLGQRPTHLLVLGKLTGTGSYVGVADGTLVAADANFNDANGGAAIVDLTGGYTATSSIVIPGLLSGQHYDFEVFPYTLSPNNTPDNVNYLTAGTPTVSFTVTTAATSTILAGSTAAPTTISSLATSYGTVYFSFKVRDDNGTSADNAPTEFTQLIINAGGASTVTNWANVINTAELIDITSNPGSPIAATSIGTNSITFSGISPSVGAVGYIGENLTKEYQLKIALKGAPLPGPLPVSVDGQVFDFLVDNSSFTPVANTSTLQTIPLQSQNTGAGFNKVTVVATSLAFTTQPSPNNAGATANVAPFVLSNLGTNPVVTAVDANGNTDTDFDSGTIGALSVTNTGAISMNPGAVYPLAVTATAGVIAFPAGFQYVDQGNGTLTVTGGGLNSNSGAGFVASSPVNVSYSNTTTITGGTGVASISSLTNSAPGTSVFSFTIKDDNGAGGDGSFTRISQIVITPNASNQFGNWTQIIAGATLTDNLANSITGTVNATDITFAGIPFTAGNLGHIADNGTKVYTLNIWIKSALGGTLPATADDLKLVFDVTQPNITLNSLSSLIIPGQNQNSGTTNGVFQVITTQLVFTTEPAAAYLVNINLATQATAPVVQALDANNNRDLDYSPAVVTTNAGSLAMTNAPTALVSGLISGATFGTFIYNAIGNGTLTVTSSTAAANALVPSPAVSTAVAVSVGTASSISTGTAPATFSSLNTASPVTAFSFNVNDDGLAPPDDGNPTLISQITITQNGTSNTIPDWTQAIAAAQLVDGGGHSMAATSINPTTIVFSAIPFGSVATLGYVQDNNPKTYSLKIQLKTTLGGNLPITIDGLAFGFDVLKANIVTDPNGTNIVPGQSATSGLGNDVVDVTATKLNYMTQAPAATTPVAPYTAAFSKVPSPAFPSSGSINTTFSPALGIEAVDVNGNRDHGFTSTISTFTVPNASVATSGNPSGAFVNGVLAFPAAFQYTLGNNQDGLLRITIPGVAGNQDSPSITISSSLESALLADPSFTFSPTIDYINHQEAANPSTFTLGRFLLVDGYYTTLPVAGHDADGASTQLGDFTISLTNPTSIKRIAVYDNSGVEIAGTETNGAASILFSGAALRAAIIAPDNGSISFTIRASFDFTHVVDHQQVTLQVTAANIFGGSLFRNNVGDIGGIPSGTVTSSVANKIDVLATKIDFTTEPGAIEGLQIPIVTIPVVAARDANNLVDLDHNFSANISTPAAGVLTTPLTFGTVAPGMLDMTNFKYALPAGVGTLTITSVNAIGNTITGTSTLVDVINVDASIATGGVISTTNLPGGAVNKVIFGVTFSAQHPIGTNPTLSKFAFTFSNTISGVFNNIRVFENSSPNFGGTNVTALTGTLSQVGNNLFVTFATPRNLYAGDLSYFLEVDVDPTANGSTSPVQPTVVKAYLDPPATATIVTSIGSSHANVVTGNTYSFAAIFPPTLLSSAPSQGQLNVDPNQNKIDLTFSVKVSSLDGVIKLYNKTTGSFVTLTTVNGLSPLLANPITFNIPPGFLVPNTVYYVTIDKGDALNHTGITDQAGNLFPGFTYSGTLYFKTANPSPPILLTSATAGVADPSITKITPNLATINATFDQQGTAYYLVLPAGSLPAPTNAQIKTGTYTGAVTNGSFVIQSTNPTSQFGNITGLSASVNYDVWMYAENDALPSPVATAGPYGASPNFTAGSAGPTFTFTSLSSFPTSVTANNPSITLSCTNSFQTLSVPLIITEGNTNNFTAAGTQTFNLVLPAGFQFDVTTVGSAPKYGTLILIGADFNAGQPAIPLQFVSSNILKVSYNNTGSATHDNIILTGLRIEATTATGGNIIGLGGNALGTVSSFATLSAIDAPGITFSNSYSNNPAITTIPDNFATSVQLTPIAPAGDYGPSFFSGPGVNVDQLNLGSVTLDIAFNITITHTDNNGCVSQNPVQYTVYNHLTAITGLSPQFGIVNPNFLAGTAAPTGVNVTQIPFNNLAAYYMTHLSTDIPASVLKAQTNDPFHNSPQIMDSIVWRSLVQKLAVLNNIGNPTPTQPSPGDNPAGLNPHNPANNPWLNSIYYYDYHFDAATLLNSSSYVGGPVPVPDPYSYFKATTVAQKNTYYTGGSLGFVEFSADFQSIANSAVVINRKENVQFFVPAVPIVEVGQGNQSALDVLDITNPVGTGGASNKGTPIFCEAGGTVVINGYPAATAGSSHGSFQIVDAGTLTPITFNSGEFVDNLNGTATLDPSKITNNHKDIKIIYNFYNDNAIDPITAIPLCPSSGYQIIRISPIPVASFTNVTAQILSPGPAHFPANAPTATSFCAGYQIDFDASGSTNVGSGTSQKTGTISAATNSVAVTGVGTLFKTELKVGEALFNVSGTSQIGRVQSIADNTHLTLVTNAYNAISGANYSGTQTAFIWDFKDVNQPNPADTVGATGISHTFKLAAPYNVTLNLKSSTGCAASTTAQIIVIGDIPKPSFTISGVSGTATFVSTSCIACTTPGVSDGIAQNTWDYEYGGTNVSDALGSHIYSPGKYKVKLVSTSPLGCANSVIRPIVMLPSVATSATSTYLQDFEAGDGQWQWYGPKNSTVPLTFNNADTASWTYGIPNVTGKPDMQAIIPFTSATNHLWITGLAGPYFANEHSALYSPSFNISLLTRPMVSFNSFFDLGNDGLAFQYSTDALNIADPLKVWKTLGGVGTGVDWYNGQALATNPGDQTINPFGWTLKGPDSTKVWFESKHALDVVGPQTQVVFRFVLASTSNTPGNGVAIDNFRIGNRTRTVLVENFKNLGNPNANEKFEADSLRRFTFPIGTELVKINYDVGFPSTDPLNLENAADPSARALYYNISTTPLGRIDGNNQAVAPFLPNAPNEAYLSTWGSNYYNLRSLQLAQADIAISTPTTNGSIDFTVTINPIVPLGPNTILQVAILEESILDLKGAFGTIPSGEDTAEYVLKKLLPTAAGTKFGKTFTPTSPPPPFSFSWIPEPKHFHPAGPGNISIVAFLQDFDTKEVWQSEAYRHVDNPVQTTTGLPPGAEQVKIYPNPSNSQFVIELPTPTKDLANVMLMDQMGKVVHQSSISPGGSSKTVNTRDLAEGLYILQVDSGNGSLVRAKVMIMHAQ